MKTTHSVTFPSLRHTFISMMVVGLAVSMITAVSACHKGSESQLTEVVDSFAEAYFNWQFPRAVSCCTPSSRRWLSYASSQVNQLDVDSLRSMDRGAEHTIDDIDYQSDTLATVRLIVRHYRSMDSLGHVGRLMGEAQFVIPVVYQHERWQVALNGLPRALK